VASAYYVQQKNYDTLTARQTRAKVDTTKPARSSATAWKKERSGKREIWTVGFEVYELEEDEGGS